MGSVSIDSGPLLLSMMTPFTHALEEQLKSTRGSQVAVNEQILEMSKFLHDLNESEESFDIQSYAGKLSDAKRRMNNVDQILLSVHDRLGRIQRQIAREVYKKKQLIKENEVPTCPTN